MDYLSGENRAEHPRLHIRISKCCNVDYSERVKVESEGRERLVLVLSLS